MSLIAIFLSCFITNNIILVQASGITPLIKVSNKFKTSIWYGLFVLLLMIISSISIFFLNKYIFIPYHTNLIIVSSIIISTFFAQILEFILRKTCPKLFVEFGVCLPMIAVSISVLTVSLFSATLSTWVQALVGGFAYGLGYFVVLMLMGAIKNNIIEKKLPEAFKGVALELLVLLIFAIVFSFIPELNFMIS